MKIIDLLNKIANGEEPPKKIYYLGETFTYDEQSKDYYDSETYGLFDSYEIPPMLNDEVEILETTITYKQDDKIEKVNTYVLCDSDFHTRYKDGYSLKATEIIDKAFEEYSYKINEIIDHLNNK